MEEKEAEETAEGLLSDLESRGDENLFTDDILEMHPELKANWNFYAFGFLEEDGEILLIKCSEEEGTGELRFPRRRYKDPVFFPLDKRKFRDKIEEKYDLKVDSETVEAVTEATIYSEPGNPTVKIKGENTAYDPSFKLEHDLLLKRDGILSILGTGYGKIYVYDKENENHHCGEIYPLKLTYRAENMDWLDNFLRDWFDYDLRRIFDKDYKKETEDYIFVPEEEFYSMEGETLDPDTRVFREVIEAYEKNKELGGEGDLPCMLAYTGKFHK